MGERTIGRDAPDRSSIALRLVGFVLDLAPLVLLAAVGALGRSRRAVEASANRGRHAEYPSQIPLRGWKDILVRTRKEFTEDQIPMIAAGVTFYGVLALFPALAAFVSLYGLFFDVADVQQQLKTLAHVLPGGALTLIGDQLQRLASAQPAGLSIGFALGVLVALWSANGAIKAMIVGLNIAYEETETRGFVRQTLISLGFTIGLIVFAALATVVLGAAAALGRLVSDQAANLLNLISWPVIVLALGIGLALLYRYGPSREPVRIRWISWGSALVIVVWLAMSALFSLYVANFGHYNKTYGALGAAAGFMTWLYLSNLIVLGGAELNAEIEHQTTVDTTDGPPEPMGHRKARMADTLGLSQGR
jgi:membrane protein